MKLRPVLFTLPFISLVILIAVGCGGAGSNGLTSGSTASSTTGSTTTGTTGTSTTGSSTTGTTGSDISVQVTPTAGYITVAAPNITLAASLKGITDPNVQWQFTTTHVNNIGQLVTPGIQGQIQTTAGLDIDGRRQSASTVVYAGYPLYLQFGGYDVVEVTAWSSKLPNGQETADVTIPTGTDWVTLPAPVTSAVGSIGTTQVTVKPGSVLEVKVRLVPSNSCLSAILTTIGFTPTNVTVNGTAATLPLNYTFLATDPPINLDILMPIPADQINSFPVNTLEGGFTGPWINITGGGLNGGWVIDTPFFIHS